MKRTPEEMEAAMAVLTAQHNAALADPFAYERAEAERLADLCRANYAGQLEQPSNIAGWCYKPGVGYFHGEPGEMVDAVKRFCTALAEAEHGEHIGVRMLNAKHVGLLLERAQRACGMRTLADTAAGLSAKQKEALIAMRALRAFEHDAGVNVPLILDRMPDGADDKHVKDIVRDFVADGTLEAKGTKRWRIHWLSLRGRALADHLHFIYGTPL